LATANGPLEAVGWGMAHRASELVAARTGTLEIAYKLEHNVYMHRTTLQVELKDFHAEPAS
jgi:hypothetical protein